jgi:hypothetical protein
MLHLNALTLYTFLYWIKSSLRLDCQYELCVEGKGKGEWGSIMDTIDETIQKKYKY